MTAYKRRAWGKSHGAVIERSLKFKNGVSPPTSRVNTVE